MSKIDELIELEPYQSCYEYGYQKGRTDALQDVLNLIATLGIRVPISLSDITWLENKIEEIKEG